MDGWSDKWTDITYYRDARTQLKITPSNSANIYTKVEKEKRYLSMEEMKFKTSKTKSRKISKNYRKKPSA